MDMSLSETIKLLENIDKSARIIQKNCDPAWLLNTSKTAKIIKAILLNCHSSLGDIYMYDFCRF